MLVLCIHGGKHAWERLAWICDVAELVRRTPDLDWTAVSTEAERLRAGRILRLGLRLADELLDAPLPPHVADLVRSDRTLGTLAAYVRRWLFQPPRAGAGTFRFHLGTRVGWRGKIELALGSLTALNQQDLGGVKLPDAALPLYYVARPARLAAKAVRHASRRLRLQQARSSETRRQSAVTPATSASAASPAPKSSGSSRGRIASS